MAKEKLNSATCKHCGSEYNYFLPTGLCNGCLNYKKHLEEKERLREELLEDICALS